MNLKKWLGKDVVLILKNGQEKTGTLKHRRTGKTDGRTEKIDSGGTDSGSCRRSVPPVPSEEKNQSNDRQRERAGTSGQSDPASDDRQVHRRRSGKLCI